MSEVVTVETVSGRIGELEAYSLWQAAVSEEKARQKELPRPLNTDSREHLEAQLRFVDAEVAETSARQSLVVELAEQDDNFLPLMHRLGLLAAFDGLERFKNNDSLSISLKNMRKEDRIEPAYNPLQRAIQIAEELSAVKRKLEEPAPITVAMVENEYCRSCRTEYDLIAGGRVKNPEKALPITEPQVVVEDGIKRAVFNVPIVLKGVTDLQSFTGHVAVGFYRSKPEEYSAEKASAGIIHPPIPRLVRLVGRGGLPYTRIDALYLGIQAAERIKRAESHEAYLKRPAEEWPTFNRRRPRSRYRRRMF